MSKRLKIGIVDLGISNITSVYNAFTKIGFTCCLLNDKQNNVQANIIVLPGVGHFGYLTNCLSNSTLKEIILNHHKKREPIIGICLGMQILFDSSEESPLSKGLGIVTGEVKSLTGEVSPSCKRRVPNIGYNKVLIAGENVNLSKDWLSNIPGYYYFLHSYAVFNRNLNTDFEGVTKFGDKEFLSFFVKDNICGIQFHPERSGVKGLLFLSQIMAHFEKVRV